MNSQKIERKPRYKMKYEHLLPRDYDVCSACCFEKDLNTCDVVNCCSSDRTDERDVYFVELK